MSPGLVANCFKEKLDKLDYFSGAQQAEGLADRNVLHFECIGQVETVYFSQDECQIWSGEL